MSGRAVSLGPEARANPDPTCTWPAGRTRVAARMWVAPQKCWPLDPHLGSGRRHPPGDQDLDVPAPRKPTFPGWEEVAAVPGLGLQGLPTAMAPAVLKAPVTLQRPVPTCATPGEGMGGFTTGSCDVC